MLACLFFEMRGIFQTANDYDFNTLERSMLVTWGDLYGSYIGHIHITVTYFTILNLHFSCSDVIGQIFLMELIFDEEILAKVEYSYLPFLIDFHL